MVCEDMRNTRVLGKPEEYFIRWHAELTPDMPWETFFESTLNFGNGNNGVRSVKIMANQAKIIDVCLSNSNLDINNAKLLNAFGDVIKNYIVVYIRRQDIVRQAISRVISKLTGVSHATARSDISHFAGKLMKGYDPGYTANLKYDYETIKAAINQIEREQETWLDFFRDSEITPITLTYEEVAEDYPKYLEALATAAGVTIEPGSALPRRLVKLSNNTNDDWYFEYMKESEQ